ncbi:MAG: transglycosylase domain-containing protein, partial [Clostridiales Family XIII bacterium]|nr:transglycosylase domain-containing protein [Clostridiales Family XIII bacterium]
MTDKRKEDEVEKREIEDFFDKFNEIEKDFKRSSEKIRAESNFSDISAKEQLKSGHDPIVANRAERFGKKGEQTPKETLFSDSDLSADTEAKKEASATEGAKADFLRAKDDAKTVSSEEGIGGASVVFERAKETASDLARRVKKVAGREENVETESDEKESGELMTSISATADELPNIRSDISSGYGTDGEAKGRVVSENRTRDAAATRSRSSASGRGVASRTRKGGGASGGGRRKNGRKKRTALKTIVTTLFLIALVCMAVGVLYVYSVIKDVQEVDPGDINSRLRLASTMYDDEGNAIKNIYINDVQRTLVKYEQLPEHLKNAFIAIEDKTFWTHQGFNFVRMLGAVKESIFDGGRISGTSTITQQLARNIWLVEKKSVRDISRKLEEAYYTVQLEKKLGKEEILTDYLNTIPLGKSSYGVQTAARSYFDKNVEDLTLIECAALACLPKSPGEYSMIQTVDKGTVAADDPRLLLSGEQYDYLYNDKIEVRLKLVLSNMLEQGLITQAEYDEASAEVLRDHLHPTEESTNSTASFFVDYAIDNVAENLLKAYPERYDNFEQALQMVYTGGLKIHTTLNTNFQNIVADEYANDKNFPAIVKLRRDANRNVLDEKGNLILYRYENMFSEDGTFTFAPNEAQRLEDGSLLLLKSTSENPVRLAYYNTTVGNEKEVSMEFRAFYLIDENGKLFTVQGGVVGIPLEYKTMQEDGNVILSAKLFEDYPSVFVFGEDGSVSIPASSYTLRQKVIQPQSATVIMEHANGHIKALYGGRDITGERNFNRATSPRQPGSTMKPIGTYGPAIQMSAEKMPVTNGEESYGKYWSPLSIIVDAQMEYGGNVWPDNWYSGFRGPTTFRQAIEQSMNVTAVKVQLSVGAERSVDFLKKLGITTIVEEGADNDMSPAPLALGALTRGIKPIELTAAYGAFAELGVLTKPIAYTRVLDRNGEVLLEGTPEQSQAMDPGTAFIMNDMLNSTVNNGIASRASIPGVPVAGKTGTAAENHDAWFVGNTPKYSASVWIGSDFDLELSSGSGASLVLWNKIMRRVMEGQEGGSFPGPPANVVTATVSGKTDYFIRDTVPEKLMFGTEEATICLETGYLATPWCRHTETRVYDSLGGESGPAPTFYCYRHNISPGQFPIDPVQQLDTSFDPNKPEKEEEEEEDA